MTKQYDNTNRGAIFKNDYKESDKQPDMTGPLNVEGVEYTIAAWSNTSDAKGKYLSISISKKDENKGAPKSAAADSEDPF